jgi:PST family polysaccharide transporter
MAIITAAITPVLFSALSRYQNDKEEFEKTYYSLQRITAIWVFPMGIGIYLFRDFVTYVLLGSQWMEASGFVGLWGLTSAFTIVFSHFASEVYRSKGNPKISLFTQLLHLLFIVPTLLICVRYDFKVLYIARSLVRVQIILTAMIIMRVLYKFKITDTVKNVLPMIISSVIMGAIGFGLQQISAHILWQFISVFICVIVYFGVLLLFFPRVRKEFLNSAIAQKWIKKINR